jgi:hypothetical protein
MTTVAPTLYNMDQVAERLGRDAAPRWEGIFSYTTASAMIKGSTYGVSVAQLALRKHNLVAQFFRAK